MHGSMTIAGVLAYAQLEYSGLYGTNNDIAGDVRRLIRTGRLVDEGGYLFPNEEEAA
jgi:hypothetical protein